MLPIHCEKLYTPPSSPASFSGSFPNSSSPPSSPSAEPLSLDYDHDAHQDPVTRVIDPFAGSYRAKRLSPTSPQEGPYKRPRYSYHQVSELDSDITIAISDVCSLKSPMDQDAPVWEEAVERAFNTGVRSIDLSSCHLSSIHPRFISDLNKVVVLPGTGETFDDTRIILSSIKPAEKKRAFTRAQTAPATSGVEWGSVAMRQKNASSSHVLSGASREHVDLYLGNNTITKLPTELFNLRDLRILSLRNNCVTYLPPEVANLENLVDFNIALNKLRFLPSELGNMKNLTKLIVLPNPFLPEPLGADVSEIHQKTSSVPPLTELALRVLLAPPMFPSSKKTLLEEDGELPICTGPPYRPLSEPLRHILSSCVPGSVVPDDPILPSKTTTREEYDQVRGIGRCPNPMHGGNTSVFVHHVEERFTWVDSIAGIRLGGLAPLRWRGCGRGCLEFLNPTTITEEEPKVIKSDEDVVHTVRFDTQVLDFDD